MKRSGDRQIIGLGLLILFLAACNSPQPTTAVSTRLPAKTITPLSSSVTTTPSAWRLWRIGAPVDAVNAVAVDGDHLWLGTPDGVLRYDPKTDTIDQVGEIGPTYHLFLTPEGGVWAAADSGLYYFDGLRWFKPKFNPQFQEIANRVYQFGLDQSGDLHLAAGVSRGVRFAHFKGHVPPPDREWAELGDTGTQAPSPFNCVGWQALVTINRAYQTPEECAQQQAAENTIRSLTYEYPNIAIDVDGSAWWATGNTLSHLIDGTSITVPLAVANIYALAPDAAHGVWLGTNRGLAYTSPQQTLWFNPRVPHDTFPKPITDITFDTHGTPYVATWDIGSVYTLTDTHWSQVTYNPLRPVVISFTAALDGGIWVTHGNYLEKIGGVPRMVSHGLIDCIGVSSPQVDAQGNIWSVGYECEPEPLLRGATVFRYNLKRDRLWTYQLFSPTSMQIFKLTLDVDGTPYILGPHGVYSHSIESADDLTPTLPAGQPLTPQQVITSWQPITAINQFPDIAAVLPHVLITADRNHGLWIAAPPTGEVWHYAAGQITSYGPQGRTGIMVDLHVDDADRLWLLSENTLVMFDGQTWHNIATPDIGFPGRVTSAPDGRIWLIGQSGLAVYDPTKDTQP